jgi:AAA15 family ATPase/GTPase
MLSSFHIKDFRCFQDIKLEQIARVNLVGGKNNTGKTTLLEALFLSLGANNPELIVRVGVFRGIQQFRVDEKSLFDGPWKWLFRNRESKCEIQIAESYLGHQDRILKILFEESKSKVLNSSHAYEQGTQDSTSSVDSISGNQIIFRQVVDGHSYDSRLFVNSKGELAFERSPESVNVRGIYVTPFVMNRMDTDLAERFSRAEKEGKQDYLLDSLRLIEPRLKRITLLIEGGQPMIFGEIGIGELIPLNHMGAGLSRLLYILLSIIDAPNGRVLIDEIDNGFHYSVLVDVWKAIQKASQDLKVQIFATTHNLECIRASHQAFRDADKYDLKYYRLERQDKEFKVVDYDRETMMTSINMNFEMR